MNQNMTNKEAIECIKAAISEVEWNYPLDYCFAFEMAINALEDQDRKMDWSTVPVDTPVYVSNDNENWCRRYYVGHDDEVDKYCTWYAGKTSWSCKCDTESISRWEYIKLAKDY